MKLLTGSLLISLAKQDAQDSISSPHRRFVGLRRRPVEGRFLLSNESGISRIQTPAPSKENVDYDDFCCNSDEDM
jgi:hypothetical protein